MKFSYNWLQTYFDKDLPKPDKLVKHLIMHSFEVEGVDEVSLESPREGDKCCSCEMAAKCGESDYVLDTLLDLDILPNRVSDCASHLGIARECSTILGMKLNLPNFSPDTSENLDTGSLVSVDVQEKEICPRYMALVLKDIEVKESPKWLKDRLMAIGQKPKNNIVDAANYVMLETGQPLHAFDLDKLEGGKITVRKAKKGEKITTLDNKDFELDENILVIADEGLAPLGGEPLAIAGIKGGNKAEITEETKNIVLEAAIFDSSIIRRASQSLKLRTDASYRYEHGISYFLPEKAILRVAALIQEIAGGDVASSTLDISSVNPPTIELPITSENVSKVLGKEVSEKDINKILLSLGFGVTKDGGKLLVTPPRERTDINIKEDVIEEVIRIYGYENITPEMPVEVLLPFERNDEYFYSNLIKDILAGAGYSEIYNYSFSGIADNEKLELRNRISADKGYLREDFREALEQNVENNLKYFDVVKVFEIGKEFSGSEDGIGENVIVAGGIGYKNKKQNKPEEIFFELKGLVETVLNKIGIVDVSFLDSGEEKMAYIKLGDKVVGWIDKNIFKLYLKEVIETASEDYEYSPISKYPAVARDVSLFVPIDTKVVEVMDIIENTAGKLLVDTDLFDMYHPEGAENKSLAFRLVFQSNEKTLTDNEVNELRDKIISALEENADWEVRK